MGDVMKNCKFINELNRLRKSSSDSIDNVEKFDQFKSYMHVVRKMEEDLKGLLRKVNASGKKTLVLLCGSAGDGKSHLLSYLKNLDEEHLIDDYFVYNDATESSAPSKTAIETLIEFLSDYRDENLASLGQNVILAINLGVLSNFIDSKYADHFCTLRKYIENSDILTSRVNNNEYDCESNFQHISFSDYNLYSLSAEGIHADYIEKLLEKVFIADEENLFYKTYSKECLNCSLAKKCPVKLNYDYMKDKKRQRFVAELLVKTIIQDKMILTTREILNFIYDIIVSPRFSVNHFHNLCIDNSAYLKEFVKQITPALLFESADITALMNMLKRHDPLLLRIEKEIVSQKAIYGQIRNFYTSDKVVLEKKELKVPEKLAKAYTELLSAFEEEKTIPTLAYLGGGLKSFVSAYIEAFKDCYASLQDGEILSPEQESALQIGTIEVGRNAEEILFTPFHPLNLAYQLSLLEETGIENATDVIIERLNSVNLLPYIQKNRRIYKVSDELYSQEWKYYAPVENKKYRGGRRYVPRLVEEKISEFISHFRYIFDDINNKTVRINLINMGDCSEVFLGLAQFLVHAINRNADIDKLVKFGKMFWRQ